LASAGDLARQYGVMLGIEFVSLAPPVGPFVLDSLTKARALVEQVAHPNVGTILDLFHFYRSAGHVSEIAQMQPGQLLHVHFCDVMDLPRQELDDKHRVLPGDGLLPLEETAETLLAYGYDGYLSLELLNEDLWQRSVSDVAVQGWASMQRFAAM
jgi:2-keto-myo-inositol isomerase